MDHRVKTEFTNPKSGWSAECCDCDYTIDPAYGGRIYPRSESGDRADVEHWAAQHRERHPGHQPKIDAFHRWTMTTVVHLDVRLIEALFGRPNQLAGLREATQRARNIAYHELGIEPPEQQKAITTG